MSKYPTQGPGDGVKRNPETGDEIPDTLYPDGDFPMPDGPDGDDE